MKNKLNTDGIDEEFLLSTFRDRDIHAPRKEEKKVQQPPANISDNTTEETVKTSITASGPVDTKTSSRLKKVNINYGDIFFKRNEFKTRQCVYISQKNHKIISAVVRMLGDKDITVGGYIDLILGEHLEQHKDEIVEAYRKWKEQEESDLSGLM